jgi:hypothetical protein
MNKITWLLTIILSLILISLRFNDIQKNEIMFKGDTAYYERISTHISEKGKYPKKLPNVYPKTSVHTFSLYPLLISVTHELTNIDYLILYQYASLFIFILGLFPLFTWLKNYIKSSTYCLFGVFFFSLIPFVIRRSQWSVAENITFISIPIIFTLLIKVTKKKQNKKKFKYIVLAFIGIALSYLHHLSSILLFIPFFITLLLGWKFLEVTIFMVISIIMFIVFIIFVERGLLNIILKKINNLFWVTNFNNLNFFTKKRYSGPTLTDYNIYLKLEFLILSFLGLISAIRENILNRKSHSFLIPASYFIFIIIITNLLIGTVLYENPIRFFFYMSYPITLFCTYFLQEINSKLNVAIITLISVFSILNSINLEIKEYKSPLYHCEKVAMQFLKENTPDESIIITQPYINRIVRTLTNRYTLPNHTAVERAKLIEILTETNIEEFNRKVSQINSGKTIYILISKVKIEHKDNFGEWWNLAYATEVNLDTYRQNSCLIPFYVNQDVMVWKYICSNNI